MTDLRAVLEAAGTVAVVGASTDESKPSNRIPATLLAAGFDVIPVHPRADEIVGRKAYPSLADIPVPVDIVDVFRPADEAPDIARQAVAIGAKVLWLQAGLVSPEARQIALDAGLTYIEDNCIGATTTRLGISKTGS